MIGAGGEAYRVAKLLELTTLWVVPQLSSATAKWTISIVPGSMCSGESLKVQRVVPPPLLTRMLRPENGAMLSGIAVLAAATQGFTVTRVEFLLTGAMQQATLIGIARPSFYGWLAEWDTTGVANGTYALQSIARDAAGQMSQSAGITITVNN